MTKVYEAIARRVDALRRCNAEWVIKHTECIDSLVRGHMPSGSGFDCGTQFDIESHVESPADRLVFSTAFHHMNECGMYDGWTDHKVIIRPSLRDGFTMTITGRDRNGIKEYIADVFHSALNAETDA